MNIGTLLLVALDVLSGGTRERRTNSPCAVTIDDIHNTRVGSANQEYQANQDDDCVQDGVADIFPAGSPASFLEKGEPENGREVDGEAADEQGGNHTKQGIEERNGFADHPSHNRNRSDDCDPD